MACSRTTSPRNKRTYPIPPCLSRLHVACHHPRATSSHMYAAHAICKVDVKYIPPFSRSDPVTLVFLLASDPAAPRTRCARRKPRPDVSPILHRTSSRLEHWEDTVIVLHGHGQDSCGASRSAESFIRGGGAPWQGKATSSNLMRGQPCLAAIWRPTRGPPFVKLAVERLNQLHSDQAARSKMCCPAGRIHFNVPSWSHAHAHAIPPTLEPHAPRLAARLQSPVPANPGRTLRDVEITSSPYTTQLDPKYPSFINCPLPCRACVRRHYYHIFLIQSLFLSQLHCNQHCCNTVYQREGRQILKYQYCLHLIHR